MEKPKIDKTRFYKSLQKTRTSLLGALLNQTIMKLLSAVRSMQDLQAASARTAQYGGEWITVPLGIYDFFSYMKYEIGTLMQVLHAN